jgi:hypothetical protein
MNLAEPEPFLTVAFGTPIDIGFLPAVPNGQNGVVLTVGWTAKLGTTFLEYDEALVEREQEEYGPDRK